MNRPFIEDKEIVLSKDEDLLNTDVYVNSLAKVLSNSPEDSPFTIGLFGEWGSGKSSIVKTVQYRLTKIKDKEIQYVTFDAWKYVGDAFRRSFILKLENSLSIKLDRYKYNLYENHRQKIDELKQILKKSYKLSVAIIIGAFFLLLLSFIYCPFIQNYGFKIISSFFLVFTAVFSINLIVKVISHELFNKGLKFIYDLFHIRYDVEKPLMFSPEQFEDAFKDIIKQIGGKKLVIIVDNIDRCERNYACELLGTIKGFLECNENVVFILPVDDDALRKHIARVYEGKSKDADEFLRKFFNVTIRIKPYRINQIYQFAQEIDTRNNLQFNQLTLDLVSKEYATNPRRIIQLFNNLSSELVCFDPEFAKENEVAICKLLIIREEFPDYYKKIASNISLLHNPDEETKFIFLEQNSSLNGFLRKTNSYTDKLNNTVLQKIVSNSNVFQALPNDIINNIENLEVEKIFTYISNNDKHKKLVTNYLIEELSTYSERGLYNSYSFKNSLILLSKIDGHLSLNKVDNHRIENVISNNTKEALNDDDMLLSLIQYSYTLQIQKRYYLKDAILARLRETSEKLYDKDGSYTEPNMGTYKNRIIPIIKQYISFYDTNELKKLRDIILIAYKVDYNILDIDNSKLQFIVSDSLLQHIIGNLEDITIESNDFLSLKHLLANIDISILIGNSLFEKLTFICPDSNEVNSETMTLINNNLNEILKLTKTNGEYEESIGGIGAYITDIYQNYIDFPEDSTTLIDLCLNIARVSDENCPPSYIMKKLLNDSFHQNIVLSKLNKSAKQGAILSYMFSTLNSLNTYENDDYLELLQYIFTNKMGTNGEYWMSGNILKKKLEHIITSYLLSTDDNTRDRLCNLMSKIIEEERSKNVLTQIVISLNSQDVLRLPEPIQTLAIDIINTSSDKIFEFENNIDFLKTIAITGKAIHIGRLIKVINSKIQKESEVDDAFEIIMNLKILAKKDALALKSFIEENYSEHEKAKNIIERIVVISGILE